MLDVDKSVRVTWCWEIEVGRDDTQKFFKSREMAFMKDDAYLESKAKHQGLTLGRFRKENPIVLCILRSHRLHTQHKKNKNHRSIIELSASKVSSHHAHLYLVMNERNPNLTPQSNPSHRPTQNHQPYITITAYGADQRPRHRPHISFVS